MRLGRIAAAAAIVIGAGAFIAPHGTAADQQEVARVGRSGYFTWPASSATPPILIDGTPPSTACLVAGLAGLPQLCGEEVKDVTGALGLDDGPPLPETIDSQIVQPVTPGTMPVGMSAGQPRYAGLLKFQLPAIPDGQKLAKLELLMRPDGVTYAAESPAFRDLVLAAISQISNQDPSQFANVFADVASGETAAVAQSVTGIEVCPATESWDGGVGQNAGQGGDRLPDVDCLIGTTGDFDDGSNTWVFDLTFAAQAWTEGGIDGTVLTNEGIVLFPLGADNLAYGDPDYSTNWLISLADQTNGNEDLRPRLRYSFAPADPAIVPIDPIDPAPAPAPTPDVAAPAPAPAGPSVVESPGGNTQTIVTPGIRARYVEPAASSTSASTPWWLLLVVPLLAAMGWMLGESVFASPATASTQGGALDRLTRNAARPSRGEP